MTEEQADKIIELLHEISENTSSMIDQLDEIRSNSGNITSTVRNTDDIFLKLNEISKKLDKN